MAKIEPDIKVDVYNQVCPMPAAMTRKAIRKMLTGQTIEIEGDFCLALENVVRMLQKNEIDVLEQELTPEKFRVLARKK